MVVGVRGTCMEKNTSTKKVSGDASWISPALLEDTVRVWSSQSERLIGKIEAIEILVNARRLLVLAQNMAREDKIVDLKREAA